jgi:hypothetical protein
VQRRACGQRGARGASVGHTRAARAPCRAAVRRPCKAMCQRGFIQLYIARGILCARAGWRWQTSARDLIRENSLDFFGGLQHSGVANFLYQRDEVDAASSTHTCHETNMHVPCGKIDLENRNTGLDHLLRWHEGQDPVDNMESNSEWMGSTSEVGDAGVCLLSLCTGFLMPQNKSSV